MTIRGPGVAFRASPESRGRARGVRWHADAARRARQRAHRRRRLPHRLVRPRRGLPLDGANARPRSRARDREERRGVPNAICAAGKQLPLTAVPVTMTNASRPSFGFDPRGSKPTSSLSCRPSTPNEPRCSSGRPPIRGDAMGSATGTPTASGGDLNRRQWRSLRRATQRVGSTSHRATDLDRRRIHRRVRCGVAALAPHDRVTTASSRKAIPFGTRA